MQISFPVEQPTYCGLDLALAFPALVEGRRVRCAITAEALEDHRRDRGGAENDREVLQEVRAFHQRVRYHGART